MNYSFALNRSLECKLFTQTKFSTNKLKLLSHLKRLKFQIPSPYGVGTYLNEFYLNDVEQLNQLHTVKNFIYCSVENNVKEKSK